MSTRPVRFNRQRLARRFEHRGRHVCAPVGFSLVELAAVMAIMAVVFMIAQPRLTGFVTRDRVRRSAARVRMDLRLAQNEAIQGRTYTKVTYDPAGDFYAVWYWDKGAYTSDWELLYAGHGAGSYSVIAAAGDKVVALGADPDYRVAIESTTFTGDAVRFDPYGVPDAGGDIILGVGTLRITVSINAATGRTTTSDLTEPGTCLGIDGPTPPTNTQINLTKPSSTPG